MKLIAGLVGLLMLLIAFAMSMIATRAKSRFMDDCSTAGRNIVECVAEYTKATESEPFNPCPRYR